jgi:hypothetical protein
MNERLKYAIEECTNQIVNIDTVSNGLQCNCVCPHCKQKLVAKNGGLKRDHHFAHYSGIECKGARMTALHLLAQQIIEKRKTVMLPDYQGEYFQKRTDIIHFDDVKLEEFVEGLRPDCLGIKTGNDGKEHRLWIEILVTHEVDDAKEKAIRNLHMSCVEIDLSNLLRADYSKEEITQRLLREKRDRRWVNCPIYDEQESLKKQKHEAEEAEKKRKEEEKRQKEEAERLQKEEKRRIKEKQLQEKAETWYKDGNTEVAQILIDEINKAPFYQDVSYGEKKQNILFHSLVPNSDFLHFIDYSPKNETGRHLFYTLLHYYYNYSTSSDFNNLKQRLKKYQYRNTQLSADEKVHLEQLISLRIIYLLEKGREREMYLNGLYKKNIKAYILDESIRNEVLMVSSVLYHHILGSDSLTFGELTQEVILNHSHVAMSYLMVINSQDRFKNNYFLGDVDMLGVLKRFVEGNKINSNETVDSILRVCYNFAFSSKSNVTKVETTTSENSNLEYTHKTHTYREHTDDGTHEQEWKDLNNWYKSYNKNIN